MKRTVKSDLFMMHIVLVLYLIIKVNQQLTSPRNVGFFAGAILLVLVTLTLINEELLFADNIPLAITVLGITVSVCRALVPDAVSIQIYFLLLVS